MKKRYKLTDLDCANCAAKMEAAIKKMTVDADDARFDDIMKEVVAVCKKVEPDCVINL